MSNAESKHWGINLPLNLLRRSLDVLPDLRSRQLALYVVVVGTFSLTLEFSGRGDPKLLTGFVLATSAILGAWATASRPLPDHESLTKSRVGEFTLFHILICLALLAQAMTFGPGRGLGNTFPLHAQVSVASSTALVIVCLWQVRKYRLPFTAFSSRPFVFLFLLLILSTTRAPDPWRASGYVLHFAAYGLVMLSMLAFRTVSMNLYHLAFLLSLGIGLLSVWHLVDYHRRSDTARLAFFAGDANRASLLTATALVLTCIGLRDRRWTRGFRSCFMLTAFANGLALAYSQSRGPIIALMVFLFACESGHLYRLAIGLVVSFFLVLPRMRQFGLRGQELREFAGGTGRVDQLKDVIGDFFSSTRAHEGGNISPEVISIFRGLQLEVWLQKFTDVLLGNGLGSSRDVLQPLSGLGSGHNAYLDILLEIGILGIFGICLILWRVGPDVSSLFRASDSRSIHSISVFFLVSGFATSSFGRPGPETFVSILTFSVTIFRLRRSFAHARDRIRGT